MKWVLIVMAVGASGQPEWRYRTLRHRGEAVMRTLMFALTLAFSPAYALDPLDMPKQWPDGPMKEFFQHLMRPDNNSRPQLDERNPLSLRRRARQRQREHECPHHRFPTMPQLPVVPFRLAAPTAMTMRTHFIFYQTRLMRIGL